MSSYSSFNATFLKLFLGSSLVLGLFNVLADPFAVMGMPRVKAWNYTKPDLGNHIRLYKAVDLAKQDIKTLIIGASRVEEGIDPNQDNLAAYQPAYNMAMAGATLYEQSRYLEHAIATQPNLETVFLGIDLWLLYSELPAFRPGFDENRIGRHGLSIEEWLKTNFSFATTESSFNIVQTNRKNPQGERNYSPSGLRTNANADVPFTHWLKFVVNRNAESLSEEAFANLQTMLDLCTHHNIELIVFTTPAHASHMEALHISGNGHLIEKIKRRLASMTSFYDFYGYSSLTYGPLEETEIYRDSSHFQLSVGELMVERMLENTQANMPDEFGLWVTTATVEERLLQQREARSAWLLDNPDIVEAVTAMRDKEKL
ncbi:MAG: hypothetical protein AAF572_27680 [Cyanobacteria bacterium P01_B01_bin.77]